MVRDARMFDLLALDSRGSVRHKSEAVLGPQRGEGLVRIGELEVSRLPLAAPAQVEGGREVRVANAEIGDRLRPAPGAKLGNPRAEDCEVRVAARKVAVQSLPRADADRPAVVRGRR